MRDFRRLSIPPNAHPLVRRLFEEMNRQRIGIMDVADRAGLSRETMKNWRKANNPNVTNLDACFGVLGWELTIRKRSGA